MEQPVCVYRKKVDRTSNRIIIPKVFVDNWGEYFIVEVYNGYLKLLPDVEKNNMAKKEKQKKGVFGRGR